MAFRLVLSYGREILVGLLAVDTSSVKRAFAARCSCIHPKFNDVALTLVFPSEASSQSSVPSLSSHSAPNSLLEELEDDCFRTSSSGSAWNSAVSRCRGPRGIEAFGLLDEPLGFSKDLLWNAHDFHVESECISYWQGCLNETRYVFPVLTFVGGVHYLSNLQNPHLIKTKTRKRII